MKSGRIRLRIGRPGMRPAVTAGIASCPERSRCRRPPAPLCHSERAVLDVLTFVFFFALILGSGVVATNIYCRLAYNRCPACGNLNAKRRGECRKCNETLG